MGWSGDSSGLTAPYPLRHLRQAGAPEALDHQVGIVGDDQHVTVLAYKKALLNRMLEVVSKPIEEARHVQQSARLPVVSELRPGERLEQLVERAVAAGQHDEPIGQLGHLRLA